MNFDNYILPPLQKKTSKGNVKEWIVQVKGTFFRIITKRKSSKQTTNWTRCEDTEETFIKVKNEWDKRIKKGYTKIYS